MEGFNEEVIMNLFRRGFEIESYESQIILKLLLAEEYKKRREIFYKLLKNCEYHRYLLRKAIKHLKGHIPLEVMIKDPAFEDMFVKEKLNFLRRIEEIGMDFYGFLLDDIREQGMDTLLGGEEREELIKIVERLVNDKKDHLKLIKKMWEMD